MDYRTVAALIAVVALALGVWWLLARDDDGGSTTIIDFEREPVEADPGADGSVPAPEPETVRVPKPDPASTPLAPSTPPPAHSPDDLVVPDLALEGADGENALAIVAEACGLQLEISAAALPVVEDMGIHLKLQNVKAATILDLITEPYGLVWQVKGDKLIIEDGEG